MCEALTKMLQDERAEGRLTLVEAAEWGTKRYMNMDHLYEMDIQEESDYIAG